MAPNAKTSEWQRAGHQKGGAGGIPPRLFASGLSLEKAWIPARDRAGNHVAGSTLRRSRRDSLPMTEGTHLAGANLRRSQWDQLPMTETPKALRPEAP